MNLDAMAVLLQRCRQIPSQEVDIAVFGAHMAGKLGHTPVLGAPEVSVMQVADPEARPENLE